MQLLQAIALLCQVHGSNLTLEQVQHAQLSCQQGYLDCALAESKDLPDVTLIKCIRRLGK